MGNCHLKDGRFEQAIRCYLQVIKLDKNYHKAHFALGQAFLRSHDYESARRAFAEALILRPDLHDCRLQLARLLDKLGNISHAAQHYRLYLLHAPVTLEHELVESRLAVLSSRRNKQTHPTQPTLAPVG